VKYYSIILNFILAIAIVVLYVLYFSMPESNKHSSDEVKDSLQIPVDFTVAYIIEDSLLGNYVYFQELAAELEKKSKDMENDYTLKAEGLQKEIEGFQRTAGNMTMNQARAVEEDLLRKRQNLMLLQEKMGQDLMKAEADVNMKLYDKVSSYLKDYAIKEGYSLIFNVKRGNAVMYGDQAMDITPIILQGLNDEYKLTKEKPSTPVSAADTTGGN
jgi:outer membrane protein